MFSTQHSRRVKGIWKQERMGRAKGRVREKHTLSPRAYFLRQYLFHES